MSNFTNSDKIIIYKNPNGDTRTAPKDISFEEFQKANDMHKQDVKIVMDELAHILSKRGRQHDYTKKLEEKLFYDNFLSTINHGTDFVKDEWYQMHVATERHHLFSDCKAESYSYVSYSASANTALLCNRPSGIGYNCPVDSRPQNQRQG